MELKEMIAEIESIKRGDWGGRASVAAVCSAAEALALVAWAEERKADIDFGLGVWTCWLFGDKAGEERCSNSNTLLGAIRAAKEAYEAE